MRNTCKNCVVWLLAGCRIDFCRQERQWLIEGARQSAEQRGHTLTEFVKLRNYPIWQARCARCGCLATINLDPLPNEACIYGRAVVVNCQEIAVANGGTRDEEEG